MTAQLGSPTDVVLAYHRAWTTGDVTTAMTYVADEAVCHAPGGDVPGKVAYTAFLSAFAPNLTGVPHIATLAEGDRVALFYYPQTAAADNVPCSELFTVSDGKIVDNILTFDRLGYGITAEV